jgi:hypothetical protein
MFLLFIGCGQMNPYLTDITNVCEVKLGRSGVEAITGFTIEKHAYRMTDPMDIVHTCQTTITPESLKYTACDNVVGPILSAISGEYLCQQSFHEYMHEASLAECNEWLDFDKCYPGLYPQAMVDTCKNTNEICGTISDPK